MNKINPISQLDLIHLINGTIRQPLRIQFYLQISERATTLIYDRTYNEVHNQVNRQFYNQTCHSLFTSLK